MGARTSRTADTYDTKRAPESELGCFGIFSRVVRSLAPVCTLLQAGYWIASSCVMRAKALGLPGLFVVALVCVRARSAMA